MADDTAIRAAAQRYMDRGWAVIPLYGVDDHGKCRCGRPHANDASGGKHPIGAGRVGDGWLPPVASADQIPPGANIGLKTGHASGVFALDVDPKNGGDARLRELEEQHGMLPPTWTQRTGSGGWHYVFSLPDDFTPTISRGRLPVGLDIRGEGGQIVLAPSVSEVGPYGTPESQAPVLPASGWLLELIRPLPPIIVPAGMESAYMPATPTDRGQAYAVAAVREEMARLSGAVAGERNQVAFRVACRLIELANAPWSGLSPEAACEAYALAARDLVAADFPHREVMAVWHSAVRKIGYSAALLPAPPGGEPTFIPFQDAGGVPPFFGPAPAQVNGLIPHQRDRTTESTGPSASSGAGLDPDPFADAGVWHGPVYTPGGVSAQDQPIVHSTVHDPSHLRNFLLRRSQLSRLPRPVPLIQGTLWRDTDGWLIGKSGSGKSFVALDWAAHVASGQPWNNRRVWQGPVIWVVAEGASGIQQRIDAWELVHGPTGDELIVLPVAVQAALRSGRALSLSPQWRQLMEIGAEIRPAMVVLDTQARMTRGLNENDGDEMGHWAEAVSMLRRASGTPCCLVVHHIGRHGSDARGHSAIDGAQDFEWRCERTGAEADRVGRLVLDKAKDGEGGVTHQFAMKQHRLGWDPVAEEYVTSLTLSFDPFDLPGASGEPEHRTLASQVQAQILDVLREGSLTMGATAAEIVSLVNRLRKDRGLEQAARRTILYALDSSGEGRAPGLVQKNLVTQVGMRFADAQRWAESQGLEPLAPQPG